MKRIATFLVGALLVVGTATAQWSSPYGAGSVPFSLAPGTLYSLAGTGYSPSLTTTGFYSNIGGGAYIFGLKDRLMVGSAADANGGFLTFSGLPAWAAATYIIREAQIGSVSTIGGVGVGAMTRSSDNTTTPTTAPIALAGYAVGDSVVSTWGGYLECQRDSGAGQCLGLEIDTKNKGANVIPTSYGTGSNATHGLWLVSGGDASYGGAPANPSSAAIVVVNNASTWNKGIVFDADAITGSNGTTGTSVAIDMARGHSLQWAIPSPAGNVGAAIRSDVTVNGRSISLVFAEDGAQFINHSGNRVFQAGFSGDTNTVNFLIGRGSSASNPASLQAGGADTDVGILFVPKGAGSVRFGATAVATGTASAGAVTINTLRAGITSESLTTAAGADYTLTWTNNKVDANSIIVCALQDGTNTTTDYGTPRIAPGAGSAVIKVKNDAVVTAWNGTIKLNCAVM